MKIEAGGKFLKGYSLYIHTRASLARAVFSFKTFLVASEIEKKLKDQKWIHVGHTVGHAVGHALKCLSTESRGR